jgi:hypothetical protein
MLVALESLQRYLLVAEDTNPTTTPSSGLGGNVVKIHKHLLLKNCENLYFSCEMGDNFGIHRGGNRNIDERTQGQVLSDFLVQLEDYTPTVSENTNFSTMKTNFSTFRFRFQTL